MTHSECSQAPLGRYDSRTEAHSYSTAARLAKQCHHQFPASDDPDPSSRRGSDGHVTSADYAVRSQMSRSRAAANDGRKQRFGLDYHHPLEHLLGTRPMRWLLRWISEPRKSGKTMIEELLSSYANPRAPFRHRLKYWPFHLFIDWLKGSASAQAVRKRVAEHVATVRGLVATARSVAEFGLTVPQRFSTPLFVVWNFTSRCNLSCRHCYQDSAAAGLPDELTLAEKLDLVDQTAAEYVPMIAFAGGEPTICRDLLPVLRRCRKYGIHTTLATHGGTMTRRLAAQLAEAGVKYVEISLDSVHPERHDAFRGQSGMWQRTVRGMRRVVDQEGMRLGIAMCVHQENYRGVEDMLRFAVDIGASCFAHFNFIPVGRGLEMADADLDPGQREQLLATLNRWMQSGKIGVLSTAPQLGRVCLACSPSHGLQSCSHAGSGSGGKARVVAKYLGGCGAGRTYICIEPNGDITPCVYMPHRVLGNIRNRSFVDIFRRNEFWELLCDRDRRTQHCEVCEFKNYCGGCRARADAYYGELNAGDPGCLFNAKHWDELVRRGIVADAASSAQPAHADRRPVVLRERSTPSF